jgi:hypothetical protein
LEQRRRAGAEAAQLVVGRAAKRTSAAGGVPGLEVGGVHAVRRQDLGNGVVHIVRDAEHGAWRERRILRGSSFPDADPARIELLPTRIELPRCGFGSCW